MNIEDLKSDKDIYALSEEDFAKLDVNQLANLNGAAEQEDDEDPDDVDSEDETDESDEPDDEDTEGDEEDQGEDDEESDEDESEESDDDSDSDESEHEEEAPVKRTVPPVKDSADLKGKQPKEAKQKDNAGNDVDLASFHKELTAPLKAAGQEFTFTDAKQIRELASKGIDYTRKMQNISQLRGIHETLRENDLLDESRLAFAIDLMNHKPEAIAQLIKESGVDAFELDEEKANTYQNVPVNIKAKADQVSIREVVDQYQNDAKFNEVFAQARKWDDKSQIELVNNPNLLHLLAEHANNGTYEAVMAEVNRQRILGHTQEPILMHYNRVGMQMFGEEQDGENAQAQQQSKPSKKEPTERIVIKRKSVDDATRRKALAPKATSKKGKTARITSAADIYALSEEDFKNLDPDVLRKFK